MTFAPGRVAISAITQANPCVVTTASNHNLTTGQVVRMHVPKNYGMVNLNQNTYSVTVLTPTTFSLQVSQIPPAINVNSTNFPAFTTPSNPGFTAEVLSVGAGPTPLTNTTWQMTNNACESQVYDATQNIDTMEIPF